MKPSAKDYVLSCNGEQEDFYVIFFQACRKFKISWADATPTERAFIEEFTRVTFEHKKAVREGRARDSVCGFFEHSA
ncbi:hypothetical protein [Butyricicoccus sp. Marseille-Q5471]|uniref:hypothetical protein n=1 Tax=Butyricicoccus sp. Marseille-Q5471 TaxID=3039493 RepID=UPI0024BD3F01|nr:hypothetical protein [Butyricicoccus sp. Marseille-Q5471]